MTKACRKVVAVLAVLSIANFALTEELVLVKDGVCETLIVLADKPGSVIRDSAALLAAQLEKVTSAPVPIVRESNLQELEVGKERISGVYRKQSIKTLILVGESSITLKLGIKGNHDQPGSVCIRSGGNYLVILGGDETLPHDGMGTRYAVITFLEDVVGIRMLWPGELGLVVPSTPTLKVPSMDYAYAPQIRQRGIRSGGYNDRVQLGLDHMAIAKDVYDKRFQLTRKHSAKLPGWFVWQRLGGSLGVRAGHAYLKVWEKYGKEHPEWFAMQRDGTRSLSDKRPDRARLCKSNPELLDAMSADIVTRLKQGKGRSVSLSPNDGGSATFCQCEKCRALDEPGARTVILQDRTPNAPTSQFEVVSLTDRMVWFWNQMAERITAEVPDARFGVYAYSCYRSPPLREKLKPSMTVGFVGGNYASDKERILMRSDWEAWSQAANAIFFRPNLLLLGRHEGVPVVFAHKVAEDLRFMLARSLVGTDFDSCYHSWATAGLNYYVVARLLWNPDSDVDQVIKDYCCAGFGKGAEHIQSYFARVEELTNQMAHDEVKILAIPYTPAVVQELHGILDAAWQSDQDATVRQRIDFLRRGVVLAGLQHKIGEFVITNPTKEITPEQRTQIFDLQAEKWLMMRNCYLEDPLAINVPSIAWGGEGRFRKYGWRGAATMRKRGFNANE